eukprot:9043718-Ditylum_brightwellii.AAC.1
MTSLTENAVVDTASEEAKKDVAENTVSEVVVEVITEDVEGAEEVHQALWQLMPDDIALKAIAANDADITQSPP